MKKLYFLFLFSFLGFWVQAQNFPYLNASTGNKNQFCTDKDTNIFMFHGSSIEKTNKNLIPIWSKTYSNFSFYNILLSKTGSIYFIGTQTNQFGDVIGKLDADGTLNWVKSIRNFTATISGTTQAAYNVDCNQLYLDNSNQLIFTGRFPTSTTTSYGFLLQVDTLGSLTKWRFFDSPSVFGSNWKHEMFNFYLDSAGTYKIYSQNSMTGGIASAVYCYSSAADSINQAKYSFGAIFPYNTKGISFYRSKFQNSFYLGVTQSSSPGDDATLIKANADGFKWTAGAAWAFNIYFWGLDEDESGNVLLTTSTATTLPQFNAGYSKIDSNGVSQSSQVKHLNAYSLPTSTIAPLSKLNVIRSNNYYFDVVGAGFPSNPLYLQKVSSVLTFSCATIVGAVSSTFAIAAFYPSPAIPKTIPITSYTLASFTSLGSATSLTVNSTFCTFINVQELGEELKRVVIYPNPAQNTIQINLSSDYSVEEIKVYDINGKNIGIYNYTTSINVSELPQGIYFLKIKTDRGEVSKKFVKQ